MVCDAETGSVAIKTVPKAKPPKTKCQPGVIENIGLVDGIKLNKEAVATNPITDPNITR